MGLRWTIAALLVALGACASTPKGIRRLPSPYEIDEAAANAAEQRGDWELAASSWYEIYVRGGDGSVAALVRTARALVELRELTSARKLVEQGLRDHPDDPDLLETLGQVLVRTGFRRAAEPYLERALDLDPDRLSVLLELGRVRHELRLPTSAAALFERRIALGGGDRETWYRLARARLDMGRTEDALAAFERAIELGEDRPDRLAFAASAYFELPEAVRDAARAERARGWLERALRDDPGNAQAAALLERLREK
jgi:tetratricopeptide (TPR) repeat protein